MDTPFISPESHDNHPPEHLEETSMPIWRAAWFLPVVLSFVAFLCGIGAAMWFLGNGTQVSVEVPSDEVALPVGEDVEPSKDAPVQMGEEIQVEWMSNVSRLPDCLSPLKELLHVPDLEEWQAWLSCKAYQLGTVKGGTYDGWTLSYQKMEHGGELGGPYHVTFAVLVHPEEPERWVLLSRYGMEESAFSIFAREGKKAPLPTVYADVWQALSPRGSKEVDAWISGLESMDNDQVLRRSDVLGGGTAPLKWIGNGKFDQVETYNLRTHLQTYAIGRLADGRLVAPTEEIALRGAFVTQAADGRAVYFDADVSFFHPTEETGVFGQGTVDVVWNDGSTPLLYLKSVRTGCGTSSPTDIISPEALGEVRATGRTVSGDILYEYVTLPSDMKWAHEMWVYRQAEGVDTSVEKFMSLHPFFFWQDAFGRYIRFTSSDAMSMAECGKPVIYLYPETTTDIDVTLKPEGGFSKTEPLYDNGWRVTASPDGTLVNRDDGAVYPYLFWEGTGGFYQSPEHFDVVKQGEVESYLHTTLAKLGFNAKETADFMEFWLPRMQDAPYYKIGWHGTSVMNQLAPLSLSVKPDTVVRVLMDFEELNAPMASNPTVFRTPTRKGFTVMEWGGVLR